MEWGVLFLVIVGVLLGGIVLQATLAAQHWRRVIADGDLDALREAVNDAFEHWRNEKPPRGFPPSDWQALQSAATIAFDTQRCRVSLVATADIRVVDRERQEVGSALDVARRVAVRMLERLLYEIPHVRFDEVQIEVWTTYHDRDGGSRDECVLTTRVTRDASAAAAWDEDDATALLLGWPTREAGAGRTLDPDEGALIQPEGTAAVAEAEDTLRRPP